MGAVGSDDDIRMKLCDLSKCCTTKVLSNLLSGEWRAKKKETWDGSKLGNCSQILTTFVLMTSLKNAILGVKKGGSRSMTTLESS